MVDFQRCLFAIIICLGASSASDNTWKAEIPKSVVGLSGSCLVIPCKFSYPSDGKTHSELTGIWYRGEHDIVYHKETSKIINNFKDRTSLLGDLSHKNCTLKISSLKDSDSGKYMFRIEIKEIKFSYKENNVSITVKDLLEKPILSVEEEMTSQRKATATCVVSHPCLSDPPRLTWSHKGVITSPPQLHENGQWKSTSSLTFTPSREDHNKILSCSAEFTGGKKTSNQKTLKVKYPPEIKNESSCRSETFAVCVCIVDSNPPSEVKWLGPSSTFLSSGIKQNGFFTIFTLQGWLGLPDSIHCMATNSEGNSSMTLSVPYGFIIYVVVASAAVVVVALVVISVCVTRRHCGRRPAQQFAMDMKCEMKTDPKYCSDSKEHQTGDIYTNCEETEQNIYKNWGCDDGDLPCDEDEAIYANT